MADRLCLCYHAVSADWPADLTVTPTRLERQLDRLRERGYEAVRFSELVAGACGRRRAVALTFDDAFASVAELALPILRARGMVATVFVPTDYAGTDRKIAWSGLDEWPGGPFDHELDCMDWDGLRALVREGWEVGSHSCSHPRLSSLDGGRLHEELQRSRDRVSAELGAECRSIAYPYGDWDERVAEAARSAGYFAAGTLGGRSYADSPLRYPRIGIYRDDDERRFDVKISRMTRSLRGSPAWTWLERARQQVL